ncbi:MAG: transposase [Candidatus Heimdallarchaeota archaeon]|nr:transposase [Candidatus Heimdallarchaeota archaeon]
MAILEDCSCAMDSSGFKIITEQLWRYTKYASAVITKTSKAFRKVHIIIGLPSRAIVSVANSDSKTHDSQLCGKLFKKLSKRLIPQLKRMFADKGYWDEKIMGWIAQEAGYPHGKAGLLRPICKRRPGFSSRCWGRTLVLRSSPTR